MDDCKKAEESKYSHIEFSEELIKHFYAKTLSNQTDEIQYRSSQNILEQPIHTIASYEDIPHLMNHYISQVTISSYSLHPIEVAAMAYKRFLDICPFEQHNKETALMIASFLLTQSGFFFTEFPQYLLPEYEKAIEQAHKTGMPDDLISVFAKSVCLI